MSEPGPDNKNFFLADGAPDWDAITFDVLCSRCGYNLRTLTRPKCPECGLDFDWRRVLDRAANRSDFLFEHHWQSRPFRSWIVTVWRSLRPKTFWASVSMHERIDPQPLAFMMVVAVLCFPVVLHGLAFLLHLLLDATLNGLGVLHTIGRGRTGGAIPNKYWELAYAMENFSKRPVVEGWIYNLTMLALIAGLFLVTFGMISGLRQTLGQCRVRTVQVLRVVAYAATPICLLIPMTVLLVMIVMFSLLGGRIGPTIVAILGYASLILIPGYYLSSGLKHYLHLPRPRILGFTAAFVAILTLAAGGTLLAAMFGGSQ